MFDTIAMRNGALDYSIYCEMSQEGIIAKKKEISKEIKNNPKEDTIHAQPVQPTHQRLKTTIS
jgi:hypothetical protein